MPYFGVRKVLTATMFCIVVALILFVEKPPYIKLMSLWMILLYDVNSDMIAHTEI